MSFTEAIRSVLTQFTGFSGRARRSEYWWWFLAVFIVEFVAGLIDRVIGTYPLIYLLAALALLLPNLAVGIRRLHDTDRSGWWLFIGLIPIVGAIVLLIWYCSDSHPDNKYGPSPKNPGAPAGYAAPPSPGYTG